MKPNSPVRGKSESPPKRKKVSERPILIGTALLILASALAIYLLGSQIGETGYVILSSLMTAGVVALFFERFYVRHHVLLEEELAQDMKEMTAKTILQGIIAGGDQIWNSLRATLVESNFYILRRSDVIVLEWGEKRTLIHMTVRRSTVVKNVRQRPLSFEVTAIAASLQGPADVTQFSISGKEIRFQNGAYKTSDGKIDLVRKIGKAAESARVEGRVHVGGESEVGISYTLSMYDAATGHNNSYFVRQTEDLFVSVFYPTDLKLALWRGTPVKPTPFKAGTGNNLNFHEENISHLQESILRLVREDYFFQGILPTSGYLVEWEPNGETHSIPRD